MSGLPGFCVAELFPIGTVPPKEANRAETTVLPVALFLLEAFSFQENLCGQASWKELVNRLVGVC